MDVPLPRQLVDTLYEGAGDHPGYRVNHARGMLVSGSFTPSPAARTVTSAAVMQGGSSPVVVRFSNSTGIPDVPDGDPQANPRGIAVRLSAPDGARTDLVGHSADGFPARTPQEFLDFLTALNAASSQPEEFRRYVDTHPAAKRYLEMAKPAPVSYASERYFMLHTFVLLDGEGRRTVGRIRVEPVGGAAHLDAADVARRGADFLHEALRRRVADRRPVMQLVLQLAGQHDPTDDITTAWPPERPRLLLGSLVLDHVPADQDEQRRLMFDPRSLAPGIEPAGDPMVGVRSAAYGVSLGRRTRDR